MPALHSTATPKEITAPRPARSIGRASRIFIVPLCPLCGRRENEKAFSDNGCELRACTECGLFFVHPYPRSYKRHGEVMAGKLDGIELLDCERRYSGERLYYDRHFAMIEEECRDAKSILDVGCGTGQLLERFATRRDVRRMGIELNARAAEFARRVAGCQIAEVPLEEFRAPVRFDVITLINVFSHIPSFEGLFGALRNALKPGGKIILRTSEMSRDVSRWNQSHWGIPDDLHFLGLETLPFLCRQYGFEVRRHVRVPFEDELFLRSRWRQMGRRGPLNAVKRAGVRIPGALAAMKSVYRSLLGERLFVSYIVLSPSLPESRDKKAKEE
jgi:SAM-dependent methyltransferase